MGEILACALFGVFGLVVGYDIGARLATDNARRHRCMAWRPGFLASWYTACGRHVWTHRVSMDPEGVTCPECLLKAEMGVFRASETTPERA